MAEEGSLKMHDGLFVFFVRASYDCILEMLQEFIALRQMMPSSNEQVRTFSAAKPFTFELV